MTRILADLPDEDIARLDARAAQQGRSRASLVREAVAHYLAQKGDDHSWIDRGAGYWTHRADIADGVAHQRAIREGAARRRGVA